jgi:hypothetical protein
LNLPDEQSEAANSSKWIEHRPVSRGARAHFGSQGGSLAAGIAVAFRAFYLLDL